MDSDFSLVNFVNERQYTENLGADLKKMIKRLPDNFKYLPKFGKRTWNKVEKFVKSGSARNYIVADPSKDGQYVVMDNGKKFARSLLEDLDLEYANVWIVDYAPENKVTFSIRFIEHFSVEFSDDDRDSSGRLTENFYRKVGNSFMKSIPYSDMVYGYLSYDGLAICTLFHKGKNFVYVADQNKPLFNTDMSKLGDFDNPIKYLQAIHAHAKKKLEAVNENSIREISLFDFVNESSIITNMDLKLIEKRADEVFKDYGIDVDFQGNMNTHFKERINDHRNEKPITVDDMNRFFELLAKKHGNDITDQIGKGKDEAVGTDMETNIHMPFILYIDYRNGEIDLRPKTIKRQTRPWATPRHRQDQVRYKFK